MLSITAEHIFKIKSTKKIELKKQTKSITAITIIIIIITIIIILIIIIIIYRVVKLCIQFSYFILRTYQNKRYWYH